MSSSTDTRFQRLQHMFKAAFDPQVVDVADESHMHAGPNSETHFKVVLVSSAFEGLARIKRHQAVYKLVETEMQQGLHAIALHLYTPSEWSVEEQAPVSPRCKGSNV